MTLRRAIPFWAKKKAGGGGSLPTTNMTAFFSIRQLDGYVGNCLRVIRDSDLTTLDIGFSSGLLDTSSIESFCSGTTGRIERWYNQVDGSFAQQATQTNQPIIYQSGAVVLINTLPALAFDLNDILVLSATVSWKSVFFVLKIDTIGTLNYCGGQGSTGGQATSPFFAGGTFGGANGFGLVDSGSVRISNTSENLNHNQHTAISDSNYLAVDTNSIDFFSNAYNLTKHNFSSIGYAASSLGLRGKIQEVVIYSDNKISEKSTIESNIQTYYGI